MSTLRFTAHPTPIMLSRVLSRSRIQILGTCGTAFLSSAGWRPALSVLQSIIQEELVGERV